MELWVAVTLTAALFQAWRTAKQQKLRRVLSVNGAGFVRFLYGVPVGAVLLGIALLATRLPLPSVSGAFLLACGAGGLLQIIGTNLLIMAFGYRGFAVGTAYAKTEGVQTAIVAWLVLGEVLRPLAWAGIGVSLAGVLTLSLAGRGLKLRDMAAATVQPAALCGLGTGLAFSFTSVFIKLANEVLASPNLFVRALFTLVITNILQTLMQGAYLLLREPDELRKTLRAWRDAWQVGALSACGSACWFTGFALAPVALVRTVGQIEIAFTLGFSHFYLGERLRRADVIGLLLVGAGVIVIVAVH